MINSIDIRLLGFEPDMYKFKENNYYKEDSK